MKFTHRNTARGLTVAVCALACGFVFAPNAPGAHSAAAYAQNAPSGDMIPLPLKLPKPVFAGTPGNQKAGSNVEPPLGRPRPIPMVAKGTVNLALHKKVTSAKTPFTGTLDQITDGVKEAREDAIVELKPKLQWVQIDLEESDPLSYVVVWHNHAQPIIYHSVIVQASNDANFADGVTTLYNNDLENNSGLGSGKDREYFETNEGRLIDAKGVKARYVRLYSKGSTANDPLNRYTEVEVFGVPSK